MGPETVVSVTSLQDGEVIHAYAPSCDRREGSSDPVTALGASDLREPLIQAPLQAGASVATVFNLEIGARLDLYVDGSFVAGLTVTADPTPVSVPAPLRTGQHVHAQ